MRLCRFGDKGKELPGLIDAGDRRRDLSALVKDFDHKFFARDGLAQLRDIAIESLPIVDDDVRWGAPVARPGKVICIGLNFCDHAEESGMAVPTEPVVFFKAPNTVVGPFDTILIPRGSEKTDWEVELGVIIGREARYLHCEQDAERCVAGYCISHDVSERAFQFERGGQWVKGKSCDTFNPLGPWMATPDEVPNTADLDMQLDVNNQRRQTGNTRTMIFGVFAIIHYLSQFMTLEPGDLISTGTPPGVGLGMKPPQYLKAGDVVELSVTGLGRQRQTCENA